MCSQPLSLGRIPKLCQLKLLCQRAKLNEKQMIWEDQNVHHKYWQVDFITIGVVLYEVGRCLAAFPLNRVSFSRFWP